MNQAFGMVLVGRSNRRIVLLFLVFTRVQNSGKRIMISPRCQRYVVEPHGFTIPFNCMQRTVSVLHNPRSGLRPCLKTVNESDIELNNKVCAFHFDIPANLGNINLLAPVLRDAEGKIWSCALKSTSEICDGFSHCLTDECGCKNSTTDVFYCADGSGCVTWNKLCDDIQDCMDASDECFCSGFIVFPSPLLGGKVCMSEKSYCLDSIVPSVVAGVECDKYNYDNYLPRNPVYSCLEEIFLDYNRIFSGSDVLLHDYCRENCSHVSGFNDGWENFCADIHLWPPYDYMFWCGDNYTEERVHISALCDGVVDCKNQADEMRCPISERFYCDPNVTAEWVHEDKVCDNEKDCGNGADECGTCPFEVLSTSKFLIHSKIVLAVTSLMGILIIVANVTEGYKCWFMPCATKSKAVDRLLLLQVFLYDTLMGVYMLCIVFAAAYLEFKGDYCMLEREWRASPYCSALGVIFSFSSHGSLLAIALISITRFLVCHSLVADIKTRAVFVCSMLANSLNLIHSILPLLPVAEIQDAFRTGLFLANLTNNPFFSSNPVNVSRLINVYQGMIHKKKTGVLKMISELKNVTSKKGIFNVSEIGYYGNTGLCIQNIFKDQEYQGFYETYKILYCVVLLALLIVVSYAYVKIALQQRRLSKALNQVVGLVVINPADSVNGAGSAVAGQGMSSVDFAKESGSSDPVNKRDDKMTELTVKVALMIGSQLACWIPFILTVIYFQYLTTNAVSPMVFEIFALVVIPINSFLNPVFYSELYKKAKLWASSTWRRFINFLTPIDPAPQGQESQDGALAFVPQQ